MADGDFGVATLINLWARQIVLLKLVQCATGGSKIEEATRNFTKNAKVYLHQLCWVLLN